MAARNLSACSANNGVIPMASDQSYITRDEFRRHLWVFEGVLTANLAAVIQIYAHLTRSGPMALYQAFTIVLLAAATILIGYGLMHGERQ